MDVLGVISCVEIRVEFLTSKKYIGYREFVILLVFKVCEG